MDNTHALNQPVGRTAGIVRSLGGIALALLTFAALAQPTDPVLGTWRMSAGKSTFSPGAPLKSCITRIEAIDGGIRLISEATIREGPRTHLEYAAMFDGKDYPVTATVGREANPNAARTIAIRKIDDYHYELTNKRAGKVLTVVRWEISQNGRTRTTTATGTNVLGEPVANKMVFRREK